jgi:hypothetical protein
MKKMRIRPEVADCLALFGVVLCSALPYLLRLGFYSDDWSYQAALARSSAQGIAQMFRDLLKADPGLLIRPVQLSYLVLGFKAFGRNAAAYHLVNAVVLALVTVVLYLVLRELQTGRWLAFTSALLFGLLPHYATARFWISAHQATLSMAFALFGIYALLRSVRPRVIRPKAWAALAALVLVLSILSYEVALGLIAASLASVAVREYLRLRAAHPPAVTQWGGMIITTVVLLLVGIMKARMQTRMISHGLFLANFIPRLGRRSGHLMQQALGFTLWTYGLKLPSVLVSLYRHCALGLPAAISAAIVTLLVAAYLWCLDPASIPGRRACLWLIFAGFVLFTLGYALFFLDVQTDFSSEGLDNRTTIASALGVPCVWVGILGLASSILNSPRARARTLAVAIGVICGMNCLVLYGMSFYWAGAASQQSAILGAVAANVRTLPNGSVLLLDGFCRYFGPAVVFETDWDSTDALRLLIGDNSLTGDVVSPNLRLSDAAVETTIYGDPEGHYAYGDRLFVFNVQRRTLTGLPSKEAAIAYLRAYNPTQDSGCPVAREGRGAKVF